MVSEGSNAASERGVGGCELGDMGLGHNPVVTGRGRDEGQLRPPARSIARSKSTPLTSFGAGFIFCERAQACHWLVQP
jgi:hypothetical protein